MAEIYIYSIFSLGLNIIIKGITSSTLAIKILFTSKNLVAIIIDRELYNDKNFKIIIDAIKIARKGLKLN